MAPRTSPLFNAERDKLVLKSSDNVLFRVDRQKLIVISPAFEAVLGMDNDADKAGAQEPVAVEERSVVFELFLQFALRRPVPAKLELHQLLPVLAALKKYDVDIGSTDVCEYLCLSCLSLGRSVAKVWSICAKAGQQGLARACLAQLPDKWGYWPHSTLVDGNAVISPYRAWSPADMDVDDLEGVPGPSLLYMMQCYDQVVMKGVSWAVASLGKQ